MTAKKMALFFFFLTMAFIKEDDYSECHDCKAKNKIRKPHEESNLKPSELTVPRSKSDSQITHK